jgi:hypothetical protein
MIIGSGIIIGGGIVIRSNELKKECGKGYYGATPIQTTRIYGNYKVLSCM